MSGKDGYSRRGLFGNINHYDANGKKIGESRPGLFGGMNDYDARGHKIGSSQPGLFGGLNHYDNRGHDYCKTACLQQELWEAPNLICGKAAVGGNYNLTRDIFLGMGSLS